MEGGRIEGREEKNTEEERNEEGGKYALRERGREGYTGPDVKVRN